MKENVVSFDQLEWKENKGVEIAYYEGSLFNGKVEELVDYESGVCSWRPSNSTVNVVFQVGKLMTKLGYKNIKPGQNKLKLNFKDGKQDGLETLWDESGQKRLEAKWKDGKQDGLETLWDESGQKSVEKNWKNGKQDGLETTWYESGQKRMKKTWKNGTQDGCTLYKPDGTERIAPPSRTAN